MLLAFTVVLVELMVEYNLTIIAPALLMMRTVTADVLSAFPQSSAPELSPVTPTCVPTHSNHISIDHEAISPVKPLMFPCWAAP